MGCFVLALNQSSHLESRGFTLLGHLEISQVKARSMDVGKGNIAWQSWGELIGLSLRLHSQMFLKPDSEVTREIWF